MYNVYYNTIYVLWRYRGAYLLINVHNSYIRNGRGSKGTYKSEYDIIFIQVIGI